MITMNSSGITRGIRSAVALMSCLGRLAKLAWHTAHENEIQMIRLKCVFKGTSIPSRKRVVDVAMKLLVAEIIKGRRFSEIEAEVMAEEKRGDG